MKLSSIQFLRAIAILLIVYAQSIDLSSRFGPSHQQNFFYLRELGFIGIDIFFVICGFIITYTAGQHNGTREGLQFLQRRFIRINPLYYIASILFFGAQVFQIWATNNPNGFLLTKNTIPGLVDTLWIMPTTDKLSHYKPYFSIGWTLAFVWLFYLLYSLTIFVNIRKKAIALLTITGLLIIAGYIIKPSDLRLIFVTNGMLLEFVLGAIIGQLYLKVSKLPRFIPITLLLAGIMWIAGLIFYNYGTINNTSLILNGTLSLQRVLLWGIPSGCIVAGCVFLEKDGLLTRIWNNKSMRLIGNASYSIFLVHLTIFVLLATLYKNINTLLLPDLGVFVQLIIAVVIGIIVHWYAENPLQKWFQKLSQRSTSLQTPRSTVPFIK